MEIAGAPLSRHDLDVIRREITAARVAGEEPFEVIVSSARLRHDGLVAFGLPVRQSHGLSLNEGRLLCPCRPSRAFDFEAS